MTAQLKDKVKKQQNKEVKPTKAHVNYNYAKLKNGDVLVKIKAFHFMSW